ncbi:SDR family oxidoreductase [Candidatus Saccharibacteria bacterium]|nr:SDR family oxidoreductase [Candidatus Saccharibacteria bacterium]
MKALIVGGDGMLGHVVKLYLGERGHEVRATSRSGKADYQFDATTDLNDVEQFVDDFRPDAVINCIGILNKVAEENQALAVLVNSYLPHFLDELCVRKGVKFVHVSTDCVFEGDGIGNYTEASPRDATSFYGRSKALGEVENDSNLTLRTSIVGPDTNDNGVGLFQWFMNQAGEANGFDHVYWSGVTTIQLAKAIEAAIENNLTGLRHVVNGKKIDKYSLLELFKKHFNKQIEIHRKSDVVSDKSIVCTTDFDFEVPSYDQMVKEMGEWVMSHEGLYTPSQRVSQ